ncbi:MAG TPA: hypothetical protein VIJ93_11740, partial [bacterium]
MVIFENQQLAASNWELAKKGRSTYLVLGSALATLCRLESGNGQLATGVERDSTPKEQEKGASTAFRQSFRIEVGLLFSTKRLWGVGVWLKDAGRG